LIEAAQMQPLSPLRPSFAETIRLMRRNDGELRTRLAQLARSRMPVEMFRCVLEAIFLWQRTVLGDLEQRTEPARRIRCVGRLAVCPAVNQLQADVLGRVVEVPQFTDSGPLGAAILAMIAVGNCDPVEASTRMTTIGRTYYPRDEVTAVYQSCGVDSS
jgi:sugar (pentulose or hexulose) kinase